MEKYFLSERLGRELLHGFAEASAQQHSETTLGLSYEDYWSRVDYLSKPPHGICRSTTHSFFIWDDVRDVADGSSLFAAFLTAPTEESWRPIFTLTRDGDSGVALDFNTGAREYSLFINRKRFDLEALRKKSDPLFLISPWESWPGRLGARVPVYEPLNAPGRRVGSIRKWSVTDSLKTWFRAFWTDRFRSETRLFDCAPFIPSYHAANRKHFIAAWGESYSIQRFEGCLAFFDIPADGALQMRPRFSVTIADHCIHVDTCPSIDESGISVSGVEMECSGDK